MKKSSILIAGFTTATLLAGCNANPAGSQQTAGPAMVQPVHHQVQSQPVQQAHTVSQNRAAPVHQAPQKEPELIKISGIGYGAESTYESYTAGQRRLMAIRSSKLDAYRSLAEQLYGIKIDSNTAVSTLTAKNDSFRARVNAIVRGARVVSITPMADRNYETVLEVYVDKAFFTNAFVYTGRNSASTVMDPSELCGQGMNCQTMGSR